MASSKRRNVGSATAATDDATERDGGYTPKTLAQIADKLGIPRSTIDTLHRRGDGPRTRQLGKRLIVLPEDERDWYRSLPVAGSDDDA